MKICLTVILMLCALQGAYCQPVMTLDQLASDIRHRFQSVDGTFALAFHSLDQPKERLLINEKVSFHAASTMKTPVMIEVFRQAKQGKFKLTDSVLVKNEFKSIVDGSPYSMDINEDSGEGLYRKIGHPMTIYDLVYEMITVSSNLATNILIERVGAGNVTQTMRTLGAKDIEVLRGVEDSKAFAKGLNNSTTAYDLMRIFEAIARGKAIDQAATAEMIKILRDQQFNDMIPAQLPKEVKVAHKTGEITGVRHDSGIVYLPNGKSYVLVLLSKNLKETEKGVSMLAGVSRLVFDYVNQALVTEK